MHVSTAILISFVTSLATAVGTVYVVERYGMIPANDVPVAQSVVPDVRGLSESDARASAAAARLTVVVSGREASADAKADTVLRQSLPVGQNVPEGQTLGIVLAEALPKVPTVVGLEVADATRRLQDEGYVIQMAGTVPDPTVAEGKIARQIPEAEATYVEGGAVTVQLSSGPADVEMPKLVGQGYTKALNEVESLGLKPAVGWISRGETPTYVILNQSPAPGTKLTPGSEIRLTVNR